MAINVFVTVFHSNSAEGRVKIFLKDSELISENRPKVKRVSECIEAGAEEAIKSFNKKFDNKKIVDEYAAFSVTPVTGHDVQAAFAFDFKNITVGDLMELKSLKDKAEKMKDLDVNEFVLQNFDTIVANEFLDILKKEIKVSNIVYVK